MESPPKVGHNLNELLWDLAEFIVRNAFGLLSAIVGFMYQLYQMSGRKKRLTRQQCILSVFIWAFSGIAIVIGLNGVELNRMLYGVICWATPIVIKPFADKIAEHAPAVGNKIMDLIENMIDSKKNKQ